MPKISVVIPTYNRARFVTAAIDSVLTQTYTDYEIIVVDDGSTDNTKDILRSYCNEIRYIYQENKGVSAARNAAIKVSKGEWIAFLDSDDIWLPKKLEFQYGDISLYPEVELHVCNGIFINNLLIEQNLFELRGLPVTSWSIKIINKPYFHLFKYPYSMLSSVLIKKRPIFFEEKIQNLEDFLYMAIYALHSNKWMLRNDVLSHFIRRVEDKSISLTQRESENIKKTLCVRCDMARFLEEHLSENKFSKSYKTPLNKFLSDSFFDYASKTKAKKERYINLKKGLFYNFTIKNFIKFILYLF